MFTDIFVSLLQERKITTYKLTKDTGISNGLITGWTKGGTIPSGENLIKLADYFNISVDYLLGRTENPEINQ
ncbi:MAG: helix-turn-helix transcriptional regulator [Oscillospiraceae bacterium]|nr:helix-turn-helix transcriptional regulator [Oscillospiraceae bacterium]